MVDVHGEQCATRRVVEIADAAAVGRVGVEAVHIGFVQTVRLLVAHSARSYK